ncbi:hypothetical protein BCR32DRAFT_269049 [Anaeromyces robustus]|uniref:Protein Lines N-terminal domain-containing protein n=1 Tax=Anaeromyces robustus TaxID=1754192 RepID=A0A1Y1X2S6_9FUNG|nr:hypothetical protein BCR32DRAFT_269049 [Anaeromyces robustus]|eukprot:ORX80107.1 hypothetical protein BCR32DRAFT_269049 [Anaeromyces robustus]
MQFIYEQLLEDLNYEKTSSKNINIEQNILYSNCLLNYYESDEDEDEEEVEDNTNNNENENEIQKFQIKRRIKHIFYLFHMLLKDYRKEILNNNNKYPIHIGNYLWVIFEDDSFTTSNSTLTKEIIFSKQNFLEWAYEISVIQIDLIKIFNLRNLTETNELNLINDIPEFVINHIQEYQYIFTEECPGNLTMITRRMIQFFNLIMILLDTTMDFKNWNKNDKNNKKNNEKLTFPTTTTTNNDLIYESLMIKCSKFKVKSYPEIEKLITIYRLFENNNNTLLEQPSTSTSQYHQLFCKLSYQKLSIFIMIMETFILLSEHSHIKKYIAHHLYDNNNTSYTTFIHQASCNAYLCQHESYLDRECICKFLLGINRWFFSIAKMEKLLTQNNIIINHLLYEITKDIDITDICSYNNLPEIIVNLYNHNDSELMDSLILLQNNYIYYQHTSSKSFYDRCPVIATILEFSSPIKLFEALMTNISYDKEILLDWIISNETSFLEYLLRYLDYTELYCTTTTTKSTKSKEKGKNENENYNNDNDDDDDDEIYEENIINFQYPNNSSYSNIHSKINNKKRKIFNTGNKGNNNSNNNNNNNNNKDLQEINMEMIQETNIIQELSNQLKYTSIDIEFPSKATIDVLEQLKITINKLSKHDLIPFSPKSLLRKIDLYYQKFSFLSE